MGDGTWACTIQQKPGNHGLVGLEGSPAHPYHARIRAQNQESSCLSAKKEVSPPKSYGHTEKSQSSRAKVTQGKAEFIDTTISN